MIELSLCMATFNRGHQIGETLACLAGQLGDNVEIVVVDGASQDDTPEVVGRYVKDFPAVRYFREAENSGVDRDFDKAVGYARGEHCWLLSDDDLLAPNAVARVLEALDGGAVDLLIVDAELRDASLTKKLAGRRLSFTGERTYGPADRDRFLEDAGRILSFIGGVVVRRSLWLRRDRESYFGSLFIHVGVILQEPPIERVKVLGESLVICRMGNAMWMPRAFEIWGFRWPKLIWSFDRYAPAARRAVTPPEPWRKLQWVMGYRAIGAYSKDEYRRYFAGPRLRFSRPPLYLSAIFPGKLANLIGVCLLAVIERGGRSLIYEMVTCSRFSNPASRQVARLAMKLSPTGLLGSVKVS